MKKYRRNHRYMILTIAILFLVCMLPLQAKAASKTVNVTYTYTQNKKKVKKTVKVTKANSSAAIQKILNVGKKKKITVSIPAGNYYFSRTIVVYSNTKIILSSGAVMRRTKGCRGPILRVGGNRKDGGGYKQGHDVEIRGGTWIGNAGSTYKTASIMRFIHCKNITVKNCKVQNIGGKHAIVFAGVSNGTIENVSFKDQIARGSLAKASDTVRKHAEVIHIDTTSKEGEPDAYPIDNTPCTNITISKCTFNNVLCGLGGHVKKDVIGKKMTIINNNFYKVKYRCMNIYNKSDVVVAGNKLHKYDEYIIAINSTFIKKVAPTLY